jgi:hypothetical protein
VAPLFRRFHRLAINNGGARGGITAGGRAHLGPPGLVEACPGTIETPLAEIIMDGSPGWEIVRQQAPRTTGAEEIEDRGEDFAQIHSPGASPRLGRRQQRREEGPLGLRQIGGVGEACHGVSLPACAGVSHTIAQRGDFSHTLSAIIRSLQAHNRIIRRLEVHDRYRQVHRIYPQTGGTRPPLLT